jgi:tetratricopeptide (TPR) repeat protein
MTKEELLERYEARGEDSDFLIAEPLYERELAEAPTARVLNDYGYLLEGHGRRELRRAVELYEQAIDLDPGLDKPHYQLISARAGLQETELPVALYERRVAESPGEIREHRFLANAYLRAHDYRGARRVVDAALELAPDDAALLALRGESKAGLADPEGALTDWARALEIRTTSGRFAAAPSCSSVRAVSLRPPTRGVRSSTGTRRAVTRCRANGRVSNSIDYERHDARTRSPGDRGAGGIAALLAALAFAELLIPSAGAATAWRRRCRPATAAASLRDSPIGSAACTAAKSSSCFTPAVRSARTGRQMRARATAFRSG